VFGLDEDRITRQRIRRDSSAAKQAEASAEKLQAMQDSLSKFIDTVRSRNAALLAQLNNSVRDNTDSMRQVARSLATNTV
jgi:uncharacterized protein YdaU (DUF1376 family)